MKKIPVIFLCVAIMTGCAEKNNMPDSVSNAIPETTAETEIPTTQPKKIASRKEFIVTKDGIQVIRNGEVFQVLEDTNIYEVSGQLGNINFQPEDYLIKRDFDGDGTMDLFVPYLFSVVGEKEKGVYYHRNPDTAELEKWDTFNEIGIYLEPANTAFKQSHYNKNIDNKLKYFVCHLSEDVDIYYSYDTDKDVLEYFSTETETKNRFSVTEDGIQVIRNGEIFQVLEDTNLYEFTEQLGCTEIYPEDFLIKKDFNGDGTVDLFVPYLSLSDDEKKGVYYQRNPETAEFEKWDVFNEIGAYLEISHTDMNFHGLCEPPYFIRHLENEDIYYTMNDDNLYYMGKIIKYTGDDGLDYTDTYFQSKYKEEQLICRKQIADNTEKEIFVHPFQCSFIVKNNNIEIYFKENNELIQTIETDYQLQKETSGHCTPPKYYVRFKDVDNDGYSDFYIDEGENAGKYFRFNPKTFRFDEV